MEQLSGKAPNTRQVLEVPLSRTSDPLRLIAATQHIKSTPLQRHGFRAQGKSNRNATRENSVVHLGWRSVLLQSVYGLTLRTENATNNFIGSDRTSHPSARSPTALQSVNTRGTNGTLSQTTETRGRLKIGSRISVISTRD